MKIFFDGIEVKLPFPSVVRIEACSDEEWEQLCQADPRARLWEEWNKKVLQSYSPGPNPVPDFKPPEGKHGKVTVDLVNGNLQFETLTFSLKRSTVTLTGRTTATSVATIPLSSCNP